jgi:hypothetical protein
MGFIWPPNLELASRSGFFLCFLTSFSKASQTETMMELDGVKGFLWFCVDLPAFITTFNVVYTVLGIIIWLYMDPTPTAKGIWESEICGPEAVSG